MATLFNTNLRKVPLSVSNRNTDMLSLGLNQGTQKERKKAFWENFWLTEQYKNTHFRNIFFLLCNEQTKLKKEKEKKKSNGCQRQKTNKKQQQREQQQQQNKKKQKQTNIQKMATITPTKTKRDI